MLPAWGKLDFPMGFEGGGTVFFTVRVWNFENSALSLSGFVEDEDGAVVKKIDGFEGRVPANAQNYTLTAFSLDVYGVGNHTYKLFLDNTDGKPNGAGEEEWSEVKVEVKPMSGVELEQVGFECNDPEFNWNGIEYKAILVCRAFVYNPTQENIYLNSVGVKEWHVDNLDFADTLSSSWAVEYPNLVQSSETATITFRNTARTGLITLEKDLFGAYVSISLKYIISPQNGNDIIFTGTDIINIKQDSKDVIVDVGTNFVLIGGEAKAIIISAKLIKAGKAIKGLLELAPVIADFIRRAYSWR